MKQALSLTLLLMMSLTLPSFGQFEIAMDKTSVNESAIQLGTVAPNPAMGVACVSVSIDQYGAYQLLLIDTYGRQLQQQSLHLDKGKHQFQLRMNKNGLYVFSVKNEKSTASALVINHQSGKFANPGIHYEGQSKTVFSAAENSYQFLDTPFGQPCPGLPTFSWGSKIYSTVRIGTQCWMAENLDAGKMIDDWNEQTNNGIVEKYCYNNDPYYCMVFGGLYQWDEIMEYDFTPGTQGICPDGFHIPTDGEWKVLEGEVDSEYGVGDPLWDLTGQRGTDIATRMKSTSGWLQFSSGTNDFNFSILPVGIFHYAGYFTATRSNARFWTSNAGTPHGAWYRSINSGYDTFYRNNHGDRDSGFSLRCLKDED